MYRLTVLYGRPSNVTEFDNYYREIHIPIASRMRGLTAWDLTWISEQTGTLAPAVHLVAELYAEDRAAMEAILESPEGHAARQDVSKFADGGVTFLAGDVEEVPVKRL